MCPHGATAASGPTRKRQPPPGGSAIWGRPDPQAILSPGPFVTPSGLWASLNDPDLNRYDGPVLNLGGGV
jgi:hypothetical protein